MPKLKRLKVLLNQRGEENKKGNGLMDNTAKEIYLLQNGKCPHCRAQLRVVNTEGAVYKTRLLKVVGTEDHWSNALIVESLLSLLKNWIFFKAKKSFQTKKPGMVGWFTQPHSRLFYFQEMTRWISTWKRYWPMFSWRSARTPGKHRPKHDWWDWCLDFAGDG